ncbi:MAG: CrcB family protein, partial [Adlercreutzia sp.]|nr:CrcB family protein [Adlercreutzia sp.]
VCHRVHCGTVEARPGALSSEMVLFLKTGVCGGFTTFSTFSLETLQLFEHGAWALGGVYAAASLACCVAGVLLGRCAALRLLGE